mgnify:CR=1 FL=1
MSHVAKQQGIGTEGLKPALDAVLCLVREPHLDIDGVRVDDAEGPGFHSEVCQQPGV